jgi:hypothetical protein
MCQSGTVTTVEGGSYDDVGAMPLVSSAKETSSGVRPPDVMQIRSNHGQLQAVPGECRPSAISAQYPSLEVSAHSIVLRNETNEA